MKANIKTNKFLKGILVASVVLCSVSSQAQHRAILADPKLGSIKLTDLSGNQINEAFVLPNEVIRMKIPVVNVNHGEIIPAGSCKIKIGLGSKLILDPSYNLNATEMSNYFAWTSSVNSGQLQITGELIAPLPATVTDVDVFFKVKGSVTGTSTITANFLVTNHNNLSIVSDEDGTNNAAFLKYTVTNSQAPVSTSTISSISKDGCSMTVAYSTDREINLVKYEIEASKDGVTFEKVSEILASGNTSYKAVFELPIALQLQRMFVRIKSVMANGRVLYSGTETSNGVCKIASIKLSVYPNPVMGSSKVTISASEGIFNGKYKLRMTDMSGKLILTRDVTLNGVQNFPFEFGTISAGKYLISVSDAENVKLGLLHFEKL